MAPTVTVHPVGNSAVEQIVEQVETGLDDDTYYYYFGLGASEHISLQTDDDPGASGTNLYTWEETSQQAPADGDLSSLDYTDRTNARFGVANWNTDANLECQDVIKVTFGRVKMVRSGDGGGGDGGTHLWLRRGA
jgi:hypothetical protein